MLPNIGDRKNRSRLLSLVVSSILLYVALIWASVVTTSMGIKKRLVAFSVQDGFRRRNRCRLRWCLLAEESRRIRVARRDTEVSRLICDHARKSDVRVPMQSTDPREVIQCDGSHGRVGVWRG